MVKEGQGGDEVKLAEVFPNGLVLVISARTKFGFEM